MKYIIPLVLICLSFCSGNTGTEWSEQQVPEKPKVIVPDRGKNISLHKAADWGAEEGNLYDLSEVSFPEGDFEIRIWVSRGVGSQVGLSGMVIKKTADKLTGRHISLLILRKKEVNSKTEPKSPWSKLRQSLTEAGIFDLPDSSDLKNYHGDKVEDGVSFLVETNMDKIYRIYQYQNPGWDDNPESERVVKIGDIIAAEFGLEEFKVGKIDERN